MSIRHMSRLLPGLVLAAALAAPAGAAFARGFDGFEGRFNLGRSAQSGAVCDAERDFDDPLVGDKVRVWDVACRGWTGKLGRVYLFEGAKGEAPPAAWRKALRGRADCDFAAASPDKDLRSGRLISCRSGAAKVAYVVLTARGRHALIAAEGLAPIADVLTTAVKFMAGDAPEPAAVAEQTASVSAVISGKAGSIAQADNASRQSFASRREEAYRLGQQWQFNEAEAIFGELASSAATDSPAARAEALYNFALSVSNEGRFREADLYFAQADAQALQAGDDPELRGLALNYKAAHARNQGAQDAGKYRQAVQLAEQAIQARRASGASAAAVQVDGGVIKIADSDPAPGFATVQLTAAQRKALRDVQAMQIEATSLEALGEADQAREVLRKAVALLDQPMLADRGGAVPVTLGYASPWLNARVRADVLRLDRNIGRAAASAPQLRQAIAVFTQKYPGSLPLAGFLVELARAEAAARQEDRALADYETAFEIFRSQRGDLGASADLVGTYFDILLSRIGKSPAQHPQEVARFFAASQALADQASADAAKRLAARVKSGDTVAAGLARAIDETDRSIQAKGAEIRDLQQRGLYQGQAKTRADAELRDLLDQSHSLQQQLLQADPRYASSLRNLVGLDELQKSLRPGEVYVKVFMLANRGYGLLITPTSARPYGVELSREKAEEMVDALRKPMDRLAQSPVLGRYDVALAHQAFEKLFGPVKADLLGAKLVIYEPDETLLAAPIGAFVTDDASVAVMKRNLDEARATGKPLTYAGVAWLGAKVPSAIALSPSAFVQVRAAAASKAPDPFYGFGDPIIPDDPRAFARVKATTFLASASADYCAQVRDSLFGLAALPQTADEVRAIAASLGQGDGSYSLGPAFTDTRVMSLGQKPDGLNRYRILFFATHGVLLPPNGCLKPALVTSLGAAPSDGLLDVEQIPQLNLDADMVVLAACDTGRTQGNGDDAVGLVTTFVEAGARNVVVSNWHVDATATERLMTSMFRAKGVSQAEALTEAERTLMDSPDQYSHPFYWAAFTVVGDGARPMPGAG